jgi:hypothetical protein
MSIGGSVLAKEDFNSANHIMPGCREFLVPNSQKEAWLQAFCVGNISGIAYMIEDSCIPFGSVTQDQIVRVVVQYIDSRPTRMHEAFGKLALEAMRDGWPCKR